MNESQFHAWSGAVATFGLCFGVIACAAGGGIERSPVDSAGNSPGGAASHSGGSGHGGLATALDGGPRGAGGADGSVGSTEPPGIQYFGRWDLRDPANAVGSWGPIGLRARFEGTRVAIQLDDPANTFVYAIDAGPLQVLGPTSDKQIELARGLNDGVHTLELFRRSEGGFGKTVISGLVLDAGKRVLAPEPRPTRGIEVVGDSISAGYGDEGTGGSTPETENGYMAFGPQLARMLDASWSVIAHAGQGMYKNGCESVPPTGQHMPDEFKLTEHPFVAGPAWDFHVWHPDVLIIELGTNDFANYACPATPLPTEEAFTDAYATFLAFARAQYPTTEIFALGTFIATPANQFSTCNRAVCAAVTRLNDARMHCIDPSMGQAGMWLIGPGDYIGDWTHPTIAGHTKIATRLRDIIAPIMGW